VPIHLHQVNNVNIYRIQGDLRRGDPVDELKTTLDEAIAQGHVRIILNVDEVGMIDSSGIGVIVRGHTMAKERAGGVKLVKPSKFALQTLKITGLLPVLAVFDEEQAALQSF